MSDPAPPASSSSLLSQKPIPPAERLIVALDVDGPSEAEALVERLGDSVQFYKLGLQLFMAGGYFELVDRLKKLGKRIFVDLKFFEDRKSTRLNSSHSQISYAVFCLKKKKKKKK